MDSPPTSLTENLLSKSPSKDDKISKEACQKRSSSSANPLHQSPQDTSQSSQVDSQPNDNKEILLFDERQKKWIWLYLCWLLWSIYAVLSTLPKRFHHILLDDFDFEGLLDRLAAPLVMTAPYWIQFVGIYSKNITIANIGVKLVGVYTLIVAIPMVVAGFVYLYSPEIHAEFYNAPVEHSEKALVNILRRTGEMFIYSLLTYGGARKYRSYLQQREELAKKNQ